MMPTPQQNSKILCNSRWTRIPHNSLFLVSLFKEYDANLIKSDDLYGKFFFSISKISQFGLQLAEIRNKLAL